MLILDGKKFIFDLNDKNLTKIYNDLLQKLKFNEMKMLEF